MNSNENYFRRKFEECGKYLNAKPSSLISLKFREPSGHHYYVELLEQLRNIKVLDVKDIGYTLNGHAYVVSYGNQKIVLVEHETGLEILYIMGSIASLVGLVLQVSSMVRNRRRNPDPSSLSFEDTEVRYFDNMDKFVEEHRHQYLPYEIFLLPPSNDSDIELLKKKITRLEKRLNKLTKRQIKKK